MAFNENQLENVIENDEYKEFDKNFAGLTRNAHYTLPTLSTRKGGRFGLFFFDIRYEEKIDDGKKHVVAIAKVMTVVNVPDQGYKKGDVLEILLGKILEERLTQLPWRGFCFDIFIPKEKKQGRDPSREYKVPIIYGLAFPDFLPELLAKCLPATSIEEVQNTATFEPLQTLQGALKAV